MLIPDGVISAHVLPATVFNQLQAVLQHMAQVVAANSLLLNEEKFGELNLCGNQEKFILFASQSFNVLLKGIATLPDKGLHQQATVESANLPIAYQVSLTFEPETIAAFIHQLIEQLEIDQQEARSPLYQQLQQAHTLLQPNDPNLQSEFTLHLITTLTGATGQPLLPQFTEVSHNKSIDTPDVFVDAVPVHPAFRHSADQALLHLIEQERLLNKLMTQIRQSLDLSMILQTVVDQMRQILNVDRMVIYQLQANSRAMDVQDVFSPLLTSEPLLEQTLTVGGVIVYEAIATNVPSILGILTDTCFAEELYNQALFGQGYTLAVADVETYYTDSPCLLEFLRQAQIKAKLVAPIVVQTELWGLLIAHHCQGSRSWQDREQKFLQQIAEHVAIAIYQAQLYEALRQQKRILEQKVIERTQELHDALLIAQLASRTKSEFLAAISHELRTPLTHVIGMSTTLLRWVKTELTERQQQFLQTIHDSGQHLMQLINDLLELSQLEAGKAVLNLRDISLTHLAQQSLRLLQDRANRQKIELNLELQVPAQYDRFTADEHKVQQILLNLLSNAIKFTPAGGRVTLRVAANPDGALLQVQDTGIGISEEQRSLLFQKFQQLDPSYQRQYEGTGLGLALTKQLVELHGGWISVQSTVGVGSVFTVQLPVLQSPSPAANSSKDTSDLQEPLGRIVLIENDEENAHIVCDMLTAAGYQVIWMLDGSTAIPQIEILQPVLVLTNTWLPDNNNHDIVQRLRQNPATQLIKVIALLSVNTKAALEQCLVAGADDCLVKPISPEDVLHKVNKLLYS
jgi:two-component system sensor histidine kinase/response regulator